MKELFNKVKSQLHFDFPYGEEWLDTMPYELYHKHTYYSNVIVPDSGESIENYAKKTLEYGGKCLFSGEHGWQGNQFLVSKIANDHNLKFRYSTEAYWVKDRHEKDRKNAHIVLIAKSDIGRKAINKALSIANEDGYYFRPRLDLELIMNLPVGHVMITTACVAGWNYEDSDEVFVEMHKKFGNDFFLEVQYHNTEPQKRLNARILELSIAHNINIVFGADSHYVDSRGSVKRDNILEYKGVKFEEEDGWYMDYVDGGTVFARLKEQGVLSDEQILKSIMNTGYVLCFEDIVFDKKFKIPTLYPNLSYEDRAKEFKKIINTAYKEEADKIKEKIDGIRWEVEQIVDSGVVDYFLTNYHIMQNAKTNGGILTTTSRGSSASFYVNKLLGFTTLDRFNSDIKIYPERFLTKDRVLSGGLPDIDYNINDQEPFAETTRQLLGEHGTYPLIAFGTLQVKSAWKMYAGAKNIPFEISNEVSKQIEQWEMALKHASEDEEVLIEDYISSEYQEDFSASNEYRGIIVDKKPHASGWLILNGDIQEEIGTMVCKSQSSGKSTTVACIDGLMMDYYGFVKNDLLIVDVVTLTDKCYKGIGYEKIPSFEELKKMIDGDSPTWDIYARGLNVCVNQMEKPTTRRNGTRFKPQNIRELSNFIGAIRPGFSSLLENFLQRLPYSTGEEKIDKILEDSDHYLLYQENLMGLFNYLGVPMQKSYEVIKKIAKKKFKEAELREFEVQLSSKWIENIGNLDNFSKVWQVVQDSARYGFNAPHAYSYAGDSAYIAYFKAHHTLDFYEIACNHYNEKKDKDKVDALLAEMIHFGISVGDYAIGKNNSTFFIDRGAKIMYPCVASLKNMNQQFAQDLWEKFKEEVPKTYFDALHEIYEMPTSDKTKVQTLVDCGYFNTYCNIPTANTLNEIFYTYRDKKIIKKDKLADCPFSEDLIRSCSTETAKQFSCNINRVMWFHFKEYIAKNRIGTYVLDIVQTNPSYSPTLKLVDAETNEVFYSKITVKQMQAQPIAKYSRIIVLTRKTKPKMRKQDDKWVEIEGESDNWLTYKIYSETY